jgi:prophage DNA circulation protein
MAWRDTLRTGSFRGAEFKTDNSDRLGGRKTVKHEYPQHDMAFIEDMGRRGRSFSIQAYVVGQDYTTGRDALIDALEQEGPGELVHPYYGNLIVACAEYTVTETREEGAIARFSIKFEETVAEPVFPVATTDAAKAVSAASDTALDKVGNAFTRFFSVDGLPQHAIDSATQAVKDASASLKTFMGPIVTATEEAARLKSDLDNMILDADALVRTPFVLVSRFRDVFLSIFKAPALPSRKLDALLKAYGFTSGTEPPATTATRITEGANRTALLNLVRQMAVIEGARVAPSVAYETHEDAVVTRDQLTDKLDEQAESTEDDELFIELNNLRAQLVEAVPGTEKNLARILTYTPAVSMPSLVVAYDLYDDATRDGEIVTRNHVRHPGFIPGGKPLEILSDA